LYETEERDFYAIVDHVNCIINIECLGLSGSDNYSLARDAADRVNSGIAEIARLVTKKSHIGTKCYAISGLCEIGELITAGENGSLGSEVRKHVGYAGTFVTSMLKIVNLMTINEKRSLESGMMIALEALNGERESHWTFNGFEKVLDNLKKARGEPLTTIYDTDDDDDDDSDVDEQASLTDSDTVEGWASRLGNLPGDAIWKSYQGRQQRIQRSRGRKRLQNPE